MQELSLILAFVIASLLIIYQSYPPYDSTECEAITALAKEPIVIKPSFKISDCKVTIIDEVNNKIICGVEK